MMFSILFIAGIILFDGFTQYGLSVIGFSIPILAILAWFINVSNKRKEKVILKSKVEIDEVVDVDMFEGEVFHNDFSKVPAGTPDVIQPLPRSIGYGYGDGGRSVMEDLERIGIKATTEETEIKKKK